MCCRAIPIQTGAMHITIVLWNSQGKIENPFLFVVFAHWRLDAIDKISSFVWIVVFYSSDFPKDFLSIVMCGLPIMPHSAIFNFPVALNSIYMSISHLKCFAKNIQVQIFTAHRFRHRKRYDCVFFSAFFSWIEYFVRNCSSQTSECRIRLILKYMNKHFDECLEICLRALVRLNLWTFPFKTDPHSVTGLTIDFCSRNSFINSLKIFQLKCCDRIW